MRAQLPPVRSNGFTLLEVLVALAVLALALAAAVSAAAAYVGNHAYLQERTLAHWVARNVLIELQLETPWSGTGERSDTARMADLDWTWQATIDETLNTFAEGLPEKIAPTAANLARRIFRLLQMRGYGRIDMRLASDGQLYVVEANPNPDIGKSEDFAEAAAKAGIAYKDLIQRITRMSLTSAPAL